MCSGRRPGDFGDPFFPAFTECFDLALNGAKSLATEANSSVDSVDALTFPFWKVHRKCHLQRYVSTGVDDCLRAQKPGPSAADSSSGSRAFEPVTRTVPPRKLMGDAKVDSSTKLAVDRTRLAYERTMMAWIRTGTSLITFGFSIYKFFQIEVALSAHRKEGAFGSANFALLMIATGLVALLMATLENRRDIKTLKADYPAVHVPHSLARVFAALVSILGILALIAVILRK